MPKKIFLPPQDEDFRTSGIDVEWTPSTMRISIGGWYDSSVGIESTNMSLGEFFAALGIEEKHCRKAFKKAGMV